MTGQLGKESEMGRDGTGRRTVEELDAGRPGSDDSLTGMLRSYLALYVLFAVIGLFLGPCAV